MSYEQIISEGDTANSYGTYGQGSSSAEFFQICEKVLDNSYKVRNATAALERALRQIGTPVDSQLLRNRISEINGTAGLAVQETPGLLRSLQRACKTDRQRKIRLEKLHREFQDVATNFAAAQKKTVDTIRIAKLPRDIVALEGSTKLEEEEEALLSKQKELQNMEFEAAMQIEKELRVRCLESEIININEIMEQLSSIVESQGAVVDSIEENVESAVSHVEQGRDYLIKAAINQNKRRQKLCFCILLAVIILIIVGVIVGIHYSSNS